MKKPNRVALGEGNFRPVCGIALDADGTGDIFENDRIITDKPMEFIVFDLEVEKIEITEVYHYLDVTAAVTYQLFLFEGAVDDDVTSISKMIFDSEAAKADATRYKENIGGTKLPIIAKLDTAGRLYYLLDYSAAPGDTKGFIVVRGRALVGD